MAQKSKTNRRDFMKLSAGALVGMTATFPEQGADAQNAQEKTQPGRRPNILIVMTDHARADTVTPHSQCQMPNLDRLIAEGIKFNRCYTPTGMCSPARASLMTGTYASTHGMWDCTHTQRKEWVEVSPKLTHWAQRLSAVGYRTGYFGKWHATQNKHLENFGWQEYEIEKSTMMHGGYIDGSEVVSRKSGYRDYLLAATRQNSKTSPHHPAYELGIDFIQRHASTNEPFCCFVSTREPGECKPPKMFWEMYDVKTTQLPPTLHDNLSGKSEILHRMQAVWKDLSESDWQKITACYLAEMTFIDDEIGRIIQTLHDTGCYEDTIILFLSDHGQMLGAHGLVGLGLGLGYEEVYHVPLVWRLPEWIYGKTQNHAGQEINNALVSLVDVCPTLLDLCGIDSLPQTQGRSLRPIIDRTADVTDWQDAYGEFFGQRFMYSQRIVWHGDWKYIFSPGGVDELYFLADDPYEKTNLATDNKYQQILLDMVKRMWDKMQLIGDESLLNTDYATLRTAPIGPGMNRN